MRLPVILVQNPPAAGHAVADALVASLIGFPGLDLTLVERFDSISVDSTDWMTLSAITVPAAVLDWRPAEELMSALNSIDFPGYRCAHRLDPDPPTSTTPHRRRLFLFDLNQHRDATSIVAELERLRDSLSVKTVSIGGLSAPGSATKASTSSTVAPTANAAAGTEPNAANATGHRKAISPINLGHDPSDDSLDQLLDQLDDLDV
ncbi:hypothetical protein [Rhodopirellula sp. MGV]|uniref:hypothetical protein n=1 Tax=Rhodopirellula sp. MGV TaxID=2023130 RepID=UPI00117ADD11|nr:hypothetical protein [Rhodopirellula sp. MGV]